MKQVVRTVFENGETVELSVRRPSPDQVGGRNRNYNIRSAAIHKVYACHPSVMAYAKVVEVEPLESSRGGIVQFVSDLPMGSVIRLVTHRWNDRCVWEEESDDFWLIRQRARERNPWGLRQYEIYRLGCGGYESCKRRAALGEPDSPFKIVSAAQQCVDYGMLWTGWLSRMEL